MGEQLLSGIRVVDLTTVVVGPAATLRLADYGAEIIKIEAPEGDLMRVIGGPSHSGELSGKFMHFNRSKRFACLNLKLPSARAIMQKLIARSDVFISNIRPNALERLGLDARTCLSCKPDLIHCLIAGFGPGGPYRGRPAYDTVLQGASGIAGLTQMRDGTPSYAPFLAVDHVVGEITAGAIAAALFKRHTDRPGDRAGNSDARDHGGFRAQRASGRGHVRSSARAARRYAGPRPVQSSLADAGWLDHHYGQLRCAGRGAAANHRTRGSDHRPPLSHRRRPLSQRLGVVCAALGARAQADGALAAALEAVDVPAMPCHTLDTLAGDPHLSAVGLTRPVTDLVEGPVTAVRSSILIDDEVPQVGTLARPCGWDTVEILEELGVASDDIKELVAAGAIHDGRANYPQSGTEIQMTATARTPPFRADQVGSLLRPAHLIEARQKHRKRLIESAELEQIEDAAIREVVALQESVGLHSISDGEFRRQSYIVDFFRKALGIRRPDRREGRFLSSQRARRDHPDREARHSQSGQMVGPDLRASIWRFSSRSRRARRR